MRSKKLFKLKQGHEWTIPWSKKEKKELIEYFIQECKDKLYYKSLYDQNVMSMETFLRGGRKTQY